MHYLAANADACGVAATAVSSARHNAELYRVSTLVTQLCERWHRSRREQGIPVLDRADRASVTSTLERCELDVRKLRMIAAAAEDMIREAREAFALDPQASHAIGPMPDVVLPFGEGTAGPTDCDPETSTWSVSSDQRPQTTDHGLN